MPKPSTSNKEKGQNLNYNTTRHGSKKCENVCATFGAIIVLEWHEKLFQQFSVYGIMWNRHNLNWCKIHK